MSSLDETFFELPGSSIRGIPLCSSNNKRLRLGFIEVGCHPKGKYGQLRDKRKFLKQFWQEEYKKPYGLNWTPQMYRALVHYDPHRNTQPPIGELQTDLTITYQYITPEMLASLSEDERRTIAKYVTHVHDERRAKDLLHTLEGILHTNDAERLHRLIIERNGTRLSRIKGKMAEILGLKDFERSIPSGMNLYQNGEIEYFTERYRNGTEIDGILTFYAQERFIELTENLRKLNHLVVRDRWHQ